MSTIYCPDYDLTFTFLTLRNQVPLAGDVMEDITGPGVAGKAFVWAGFHGDVETVMSVMALAAGEPVGIRRMQQRMFQGHVVTVTDDYGAIWTEVMCRGVRHGQIFPIVAGAGLLAGKAVVMMTEWSLEPACQYYSWIES
jgi:hypothetical protein